MHDVMPSSTTIAVLLNPANIRQAATERTIIQNTARTLDARVVILEASTPSEIESVFATIVRERLGALVVSGENLFLSQRDRLVEMADQHRVQPSMRTASLLRRAGFFAMDALRVGRFSH